MAKSCAIIPKVQNRQGEKVDSKLYTDLLSVTPTRGDATRIYLTTKNEDFMRDFGSKLKLDNNNEPTFHSLRKAVDIGKSIDEFKLLTKLNTEIGNLHRQGRDRGYPDTPLNRRTVTDKATNFNNNSEFNDDYVAIMEKSMGPEGQMLIRPVVKPKTRELARQANQMTTNQSLNDKLRDILSSYGISIGALTALEERSGINGVTDFSQAKHAAEGLIELIRLAKGEKGEAALPEEFAHFIIEALGNNPLAQRLIGMLQEEGLAREIIGEEYSQYEQAYNGDKEKLAKEAAGKLLAKHLIANEQIPRAPYKSLLQRFMDFVNNFLGKLDAAPFRQAMIDADKEFSKLAKNILTQDGRREISVQNIATTEKFYNLEERVTRDKKLLSRIIEREKKRLNIYKKRSGSNKFEKHQTNLIESLYRAYDANKELEGIFTYIEQGISQLGALSSRLADVENNTTSTLNDKAKVLRDIRNYIKSYSGVIDSIRQAKREEDRSGNSRYEAKMVAALDQFTTLLADLEADYKTIASPLFLEFIKPFMGVNMIIPFAKDKGKKYTAEELLEETQDIKFMDRWIDSMAQSKDMMNKLMDRAVKRQKEKIRQDVISAEKKLKAAGIKLEQSGVKDVGWIYERDKDGNLTGNFISDVDYALFNERKAALLRRLDEKYGTARTTDEMRGYGREREEWTMANTEVVDGVRRPRRSIYNSNSFNSLNAAQKEFYNTIINMKEMFDNFLPEGVTDTYNSPKVRKDFLERMLKSGGISAAFNELGRSAKETVGVTSADTEMAGKEIITDFEDRKVDTLPVYFLKFKDNESIKDMSTDVVSSMIAYANMAYNYKGMNEVIHILETGRDLLQERTVIKNKTDKEGNKVTVSGKEARVMERLNDFFSMQVYNQFMKNEEIELPGTEKKINLGKGADLINRLTSMADMGLSLLLGISNVATGDVAVRVEAIHGEHFKHKDLVKADRIYFKNIPAFLAEIGNRVKTSKMALWQEKFNTTQDYNQSVKNADFARKTWFSRMFNINTMFFLSNAGEHFMQNRTSLALASAYKMKDAGGNIVNLWDAMEVAYIDPTNHALGGELRVKPGYTKEDGSKFTEEDVFAFTQKAMALNEGMHGIYNEADRNAFQALPLPVAALHRGSLPYGERCLPIALSRRGNILVESSMNKIR
jgi:hypothetical protein